MAWPTPNDYDEAVQNLQSSMSDEELRAGHTVLDDQQLPMLWSGGFANVYKIHCPATGNTWALKLFTKEVPEQGRRYPLIDECLKRALLPFTVPFFYFPHGVRVAGEWFPALKMKWIEGQTLNRFVEDSLGKPGMLKQLLDWWPKLAALLRGKGIAHADLQHGNVLLVPMPEEKLAIKLIDYDGMFVPTLAGTRSGELGHPAYQHPKRAAQRAYNADVDRFSHLVIYTAVRCLSAGRREAWRRFNNGDNLLFRETDFTFPDRSPALRAFWECGDRDVRTLVGRLALACGQRLEEVPWLDQVLDKGQVVPLSRGEEKEATALLTTPTPPRAKGEAQGAQGEGDSATVPNAEPSGTAPTVPLGRRVGAAGRSLLRGFPAVARGLDRILRRLVGDENHILRYFLWAVLPLLLLGAVWAGIMGLTPSPAPREPQPITPGIIEAPKPRPAVYVVTVDPHQGTVSVAGKGASIEGGDAEWIITVAEPDGQAKVTVVATLAGYETLAQELQPKPGESGLLTLRLKASAPAALRLRPIEAKTAEAGKPLNLTVSVENPDAWKGELHYVLAKQAPQGATIDTERGVFTWTPTADQAAGEYDVTVSVGGPGGRTDQTSFAVKVAPSLHASATAEGPTTPLADLPVLEEVAATWSPATDARSTSIRAAREEVLQGLEEKAWDSLLGAILPFRTGPGATRPGNTQQPTGIPERFILTGRLAALRVSEGKSLVFVEPDQHTPSPLASSSGFFSNGQFRMMGNAGIAPFAAVEFDGETLGWTMSDYRVGDAIRVAVQRLTKNKLESVQSGPQVGRVSVPYNNMPLMFPGVVDELRLTRFAQTLIIAPSSSSSRNFGVPCWCFLGKGLEKAQQTDSWIDARLGRAGSMAADLIHRSPGFLLRIGRRSKGTSGRLVAKIDRVARFQQDLVVYLTVPDTTEGAIRCAASLGSTAQAAEFFDYRPGVMVEVAATVDDPLSNTADLPVDTRPHGGGPRPMDGNMSPSSDRATQPPPPLPTIWAVLRLNCGQIRIQAQPATLVDARGPTRRNLTISPATPDVAQFDLDKVKGQEATWSGKLARVRCRNGETHLVVSVPLSILGVSQFEAYADDSAFVDELADYIDSQDSSKDADEISVAGTICSPNASRIRLQPGTPLLRMKQVDCAKRPQARATVGMKRDPGTFRNDTLHTALAALLRNPPSAGTNITFTGRYLSFNPFNKIVRVESESKSSSGITAEITFVDGAKATFADYRYGAIVEVTGTLSQQTKDLDTLKIDGKTIVRKETRVGWPGTGTATGASAPLKIQPISPQHIEAGKRLNETPLPKPAVRLSVQPIPPQTIEAGKRLLVPVKVEDSPRWKGKLRYTLAANAPRGARINSLGTFSWMPPLDHVAGPELVTVTVDGPDGQSVQVIIMIRITRAGSGLRPILPQKPG
jgi:hypothetical protein